MCSRRVSSSWSTLLSCKSVIIFVPSVFSNVLEIKNITDTSYFQIGNGGKLKQNLVLSLNFTFRYIDDILLLNNSNRFGGFVDRIYLDELEIKDTTDTARSASK